VRHVIASNPCAASCARTPEDSPKPPNYALKHSLKRDGFANNVKIKLKCLIKDRVALLAFYDFPAETGSICARRTSSKARSQRCATARCAPKGCLSNKTALAMIFKLAEAAEKSWRRLDGHNQLPKVILGVKFTDGIEVVRSQAQAAAA
jgi:hypothetical protein